MYKDIPSRSLMPIKITNISQDRRLPFMERVKTQFQSQKSVQALKKNNRGLQRRISNSQVLLIKTLEVRKQNQEKARKSRKQIKKINIAHSKNFKTEASIPPKREDQNQAFFQRSRYSRFHFSHKEVIGKGTFGVVYRSVVEETGEQVAIKRVYIDRNYKNRELQILSELDHPNVIFMRHHYKVTQNSGKEYLHIVMQHLPKSLIDVIRNCQKSKIPIAFHVLRSYIYQLLKSVAYIHDKSIVHRDIKPHNILIDPRTNRLLLCDFGSAKKIVRDQINIAYICSRCYRAPQLIFGKTNYGPSVDMWSVGCVIAQMINAQPLFVGQNNIGQLIEIINVLGTPSPLELKALNQGFELQEIKLPVCKRRQLKKLMRRADTRLLDLLQKILVYSPDQRISARQALLHPYFQQERSLQSKKLTMLEDN